MAATTLKRSLLVCGCAAALLLAGCWDGDDDGDDTPAVTSAVPASASESPTGFIAYLKQLVVASADTLEPVAIDAVTPPAADTTEPEAI